MKDFVAATVVHLIFEYIKSRVGPRLAKTQVKLELTVENEAVYSKLHYEGPAKEFTDTMIPAIEKLIE